MNSDLANVYRPVRKELQKKALALAASFVFLSNLQVGSIGAEVRELQKALNSDLSTVVATSGPGSVGNETEYFGPKTAAAVTRFQNKYASEILAPLGLSSGTGFVGNATRAKLNSLLGSGATSALSATSGANTSSATLPTNTPASITGATLGTPLGSATAPSVTTVLDSLGVLGQADNTTVRLAFLSKSYGRTGTQLELSGSGFAPTGNTVYFDALAIPNVSAQSANKITFTIPASVPPGVYMNVEVGNEKGVSSSNSFFIVTNDATDTPPKITSVTPTEVSLGGQVTITGENFTPTGNIVRSTLGVFTGLSSSDGKTLTLPLTASADLGLARLFMVEPTFTLKVYMYVINTHGMSAKDSPGIITLVK